MVIEHKYEKKYSDEEDYVQRQQNIDAILVLVRVCELEGSPDIKQKAQNKISILIDQI